MLIQLRRVFQSPEVTREALRIIQAREESDRTRLAAERTQLDEQIGLLRTNASRLLQSSLGKADGHAFVTDELARMNQDLTGLEERLAAVNAEHDLLTREPTTHEALVHELNAFDRIWDELFPAEQTRLTRLVVERVTVMSDGIDLVVRTDGVDSVVAELVGGGIDYHRG